MGFDLLRTHANTSGLATAGLLGILGLPLEVQGYWTEHSERSVLPRLSPRPGPDHRYGAAAAPALQERS